MGDAKASDRRLKIAILAIGGVDRSGTDRVIPCLLWLIERLAAAGHEIHVFVPAQEEDPGTWTLLGTTVHNAGRGPWRLRTIASLVREHRAGRFDVIHAFWTAMGAVAALASKVLRVPMVLTMPGGDAVAIPEVGYGALLSLRGRAALRISAAAASRITTPSACMREVAARRGVEAIAVAQGVDIDRTPPSPPRPRDLAEPLKLIHVASLNRVKDQHTLLAAMGALKDRGIAFELRAIGFDTMDGEMQRLAGELGLGKHVRFFGELRYEALWQYYRWADLLVMSSRSEGAPIVFLEAAVGGLPTVGTCVGHIADLAPDAAVAVPIADPTALASAIEALAADEPRRMRLARAAQAFAIAHDAAFTTRTFAAIYRELAAKR